MSSHVRHAVVLRRDEKEFVRFLNMAINDVTYLLDESLQLLKKIHDIETDIDNKEEWEATPMVRPASILLRSRARAPLPRRKLE